MKFLILRNYFLESFLGSISNMYDIFENVCPREFLLFMNYYSKSETLSFARKIQKHVSSWQNKYETIFQLAFSSLVKNYKDGFTLYLKYPDSFK